MNFPFKRLATFLFLIHVLILVPEIKTLSQNFPPMEITIHDSAATQGYYFFAPYASSPPYFFQHPQLILDRFGNIVWYRILPGLIHSTTTYDFKIQPDRRMSYYSLSSSKYQVMDSTFTVKDSLGAANGFNIDVHDLQFLSNGHYLLLAQESRYMNLTAYHIFGMTHSSPGGANAEVIGVVIQEFDENKNLVWQWKAHDHFAFNDVDSMFLFSPTKVDWTHANAVEEDDDGNILLSCRHFDEITKINRQTGAIIWRLGGKRNQFNFTNDPLRFSGQHDIRRISNGHITIFDNGLYHNPPLARALEYDLNEVTKTAALVWNYSYSSSLSSMAVGSHQALPNGNHLVDFGAIPEGYPWFVLVKPDKSVAMEISQTGSYTSYRAFNYDTLPWALPRPLVECYKSGKDYFLEAEPGHPEYLWSTGATTQSIQITAAGKYWVYVPLGEGYLSSKQFVVSDTSNPCMFVSEKEPLEGVQLSVDCIPNPARDQAKIIFDLPVKLEISIEILDLESRERITIPASVHPSGKNMIPVDLSRLEKGIYFLRFIAGQTVITKKIIVQ
ncbi:MAG: aryl-sulfate sulfotransferase [Bacteroidota bacterium]